MLCLPYQRVPSWPPTRRPAARPPCPAGTCGAVLVLTIPGCFLIQYAHSKQRESRAALAAAAREPLLPEGGGVAAAAATPGPAWLAGRAGRGYSMWGSKLFWAGVLLQLLSALLCGVTIATVVHPHA